MAITPLVKKDGTRLDGKDENDAFEELKILLAKGKEIKIMINDELCLVEIKPFDFDRLPEILEVVSPILNKLKTDVAPNKETIKAAIKGFDTLKMITFVSENKDQIYKVIMAFEPAFTLESVKTLKADDIVEVVFAIIEVNMDFFIRRLSPAMVSSLNSLVTLIPQSISAYAKR